MAAGGLGFHGMIDEVRVYAAGLTAAAVNEQMFSTDASAAVALASDAALQASKHLVAGAYTRPVFSSA